MSKYLYILSEGELDEMFYERVAERATRMSFLTPTDLRQRRGANWKTAIAGARLLLSYVTHWHGQQQVSIIIAVDNDRSSGHPGSAPPARQLPPQDQKKTPRYPDLIKMLFDSLGQDRAAWPIDVALAVPVEMIESWVLTLVDPSRASMLPLFAEASQHSARIYYGSNPPPQLKDLRNSEASALGKDMFEFFWHAAEQDLEVAANASKSFEMFLDELREWRPAID